MKRLERRAYRTIEKQKQKIKDLENEIRRQKRKHRKLVNMDSSPKLQKTSDSPATKASMIISSSKQSEFWKQLTLGLCLADLIQSKTEQIYQAKEGSFCHRSKLIAKKGPFAEQNEKRPTTVP